MMYKICCIAFVILIGFASCKKSDGGSSGNPVTPTLPFNLSVATVNNVNMGFTHKNVNFKPVIRFSFAEPVQSTSVTSNITFNELSGTAVSYSVTYENNDSTVVITPNNNLAALNKYIVRVLTGLQSKKGGKLQNEVALNLITQIDSSRKFPTITDEELLTLVQQQTFKYFWDFGHPVSGLARERNTSGDVVTTGGSGFGIMAIPVAINRQFITRAEGLARMQKIVSFLKNTAQTFHGAFPHWLNGNTGVVVPFSTKDNGADLVETSFFNAGFTYRTSVF